MGKYEDADIVYRDVDFRMTDAFSRLGYPINRGEFAKLGDVPTYFLEIKSTPSGCNTPFFLSTYQRSRVSYATTQCLSLVFPFVNPL